MDLTKKLEILSDSAKYDVSCSSSGSERGNSGEGLGSASKNGICHSFSADGRCISLLKILMSNVCIYECSYCINRSSSNIQRATFTPAEIVRLTIGFYRRNYIEGLFLSSGVIKSPDHTMEMMVETIRLLREEQKFYGYIHLKLIPGSSEILIQQALKYADRVSSNIELPSLKSLNLLAPDKAKTNLIKPFDIALNHSSNLPSTKRASAISMSTQMIVGATPESDFDILKTSSTLYKKPNLKRVYYSAYIPTNNDKNLPSTTTTPPLLREHRLYQADWLLRVYKFPLDDIVDKQNSMLDEKFDPKISWALRNLNLFPIEINRASFEMLIRVPGIGIKGAMKIIKARKHKNLGVEELKKLKISIKRAGHFILTNGRYPFGGSIDEDSIKKKLLLSQREEALLF